MRDRGGGVVEVWGRGLHEGGGFRGGVVVLPVGVGVGVGVGVRGVMGGRA